MPETVHPIDLVQQMFTHRQIPMQIDREVLISSYLASAA